MSANNASTTVTTAREVARNKANGQFGTQELTSTDDINLFDPVDHVPGVDSTYNDEMFVDLMARNPQKVIDDLNRMAAKQIRDWHLQGGVDNEDLTQYTLEALFTAINKGTLRDGRVGPVFVQARNIIAHQIKRNHNAGFRFEDSNAAKLYTEWRRKFEDMNGRPITKAEGDAMAEKIRDNWPDQKRKPSKSFREVIIRRGDVLSIDALGSGDGGSEIQVEQRSTGHYVAPGSHMDRALDGIDGVDGATMRQAKRLMWNALSELGSAPVIETPHISTRTHTVARTTLASAGGVNSALARFDDGHTPGSVLTGSKVEGDPQMTAFFIPWKGAAEDPEMRNDIVRQFRNVQDYAREEMWASALQLATVRNS